MRFRALPVEPAIVEAVRWNGEQFDGPVPEWARAAILKPGGRGSVKRHERDLLVDTGLGSSFVATPGDWLVRTADGELSVCEGSFLAAHYEAVD